MSKFFKQFPKVEYDFNRKGVLQNMTDIFRSVRALPAFLDDFNSYTFYQIRNGERPDIVSQRLYGNQDYYWTFFIINDFLHDGYREWPLTEENLFDCIAKDFSGFAITTNPVVRRDSDGIVRDHENSLAGRFQIGETVVGSISGATGTLTKKNIDMNQLVIQNTTGTFLGDPTAIDDASELIIGQTTNDSVSTHRVFKYADAPYYYYVEGDAEKKPVTNGLHITGGIAESNLAYITNRAHQIELNDNRSRIRIVDPNYITQFVRKFRKLINE